MNRKEFEDLFARSGKRVFFIGSDAFGVYASPDLEARIFLVYKGELLSRVNADAILNYSDRTQYRNPGGDGLWAAPEGSLHGFNYAPGAWSVATGLLRARFDVEQSSDRLVLKGEVPLITSAGLGFFTVFSRSIQITGKNETTITDEIEYLGPVKHAEGTVRLAAWSLSQFDRHDGDYCELKTPGTIRDLYTDSSAFRKDNLCYPTDEKRYQVACGEACTGITLHLKDRKVAVYREVTDKGGKYIDIADIDPKAELSDTAVKYSFYTDPSAFMEIETAGPATRSLVPGQKVSLTSLNRIIPE